MPFQAIVKKSKGILPDWRVNLGGYELSLWQIYIFTLDIPFVLPNDAVDNNDRQDEENEDADDNGFLDKRAVEKRNDIAAYYAAVVEYFDDSD